MPVLVCRSRRKEKRTKAKKIMRMRTVTLRLYSLVTFSVATLLILCFMASLTNLAHKPSSVSSQLHVQLQQIFVFVAVEYITSSNAVNQVSLWDRIVTEKEQAKFHVYTSNKYSFLDEGSNLWKSPFNLTVYCSVLPITGLMFSDRKTFEAFNLLPSSIHGE